MRSGLTSHCSRQSSAACAWWQVDTTMLGGYALQLNGRRPAGVEPITNFFIT
jgi:hypothetical protein